MIRTKFRGWGPVPDTSLWNQAGPGGLQSPEARQFFYLHILPCVSRPFSWGIIARLSSLQGPQPDPLCHGDNRGLPSWGIHPHLASRAGQDHWVEVCRGGCASEAAAGFWWFLTVAQLQLSLPLTLIVSAGHLSSSCRLHGAHYSAHFIGGNTTA